jgi:hypothetical protein
MLDFVQAIKILAFISHDIFQSLWGGACAGSNRIAISGDAQHRRKYL